MSLSSNFEQENLFASFGREELLELAQIVDAAGTGLVFLPGIWRYLSGLDDERALATAYNSNFRPLRYIQHDDSLKFFEGGSCNEPSHRYLVYLHEFLKLARESCQSARRIILNLMELRCHVQLARILVCFRTIVRVLYIYDTPIVPCIELPHLEQMRMRVNSKNYASCLAFLRVNVSHNCAFRELWLMVSCLERVVDTRAEWYVSLQISQLCDLIDTIYLNPTCLDITYFFDEELDSLIRVNISQVRNSPRAAATAAAGAAGAATAGVEESEGFQVVMLVKHCSEDPSGIGYRSELIKALFMRYKPSYDKSKINYGLLSLQELTLQHFAREILRLDFDTKNNSEEPLDQLMRQKIVSLPLTQQRLLFRVLSNFHIYKTNAEYFTYHYIEMRDHLLSEYHFFFGSRFKLLCSADEKDTLNLESCKIFLRYCKISGDDDSKRKIFERFVVPQ